MKIYSAPLYGFIQMSVTGQICDTFSLCDCYRQTRNQAFNEVTIVANYKRILVIQYCIFFHPDL